MEILSKDTKVGSWTKTQSLALPENVFIKRHLVSVQQGGKVWSRIS